jgi:A/G-specific adenine glycosylase
MFLSKLYSWHTNIDRDLPWTLTKDPYKIWLSEIILQQTRVDQGRDYYIKFITLWPTVVDLADANSDDILRAWQGLGYYSRARNLHFSAQLIRDNYHGVFPSAFDEIIKLKGVGAYTAAAIASFAFGLCYPVLDGNVMRVISRYHGITAPVDEPTTIKKVNEILEATIDRKDPGHFNQAMMDFGATYCTPKNPDCGSCVYNNSCKAYIEGMVDSIPLKVKKVKRKVRYFHYLDISDSQHIIVEKRRDKDIWQGLYQLPLIEKTDDSQIFDSTIYQSSYFSDNEGDYSLRIVSSQKLQKHILTHQDIMATVHQIEMSPRIEISSKLCDIIPLATIDKIGFPKLLVSYLEKYKIID